MKSGEATMAGFKFCPNKVEKILEGSLDLIPSPSLLVKIQIVSGKVCKAKQCFALLPQVNLNFH
jgi:hypothetical protein